VTRGDGDTVSDPPMSALVSQLLVAFAMEYEEQSPVALSLSTGVISQIADQGQPLREIGPLCGSIRTHSSWLHARKPLGTEGLSCV